MLSIREDYNTSETTNPDQKSRFQRQLFNANFVVKRPCKLESSASPETFKATLCEAKLK